MGIMDSDPLTDFSGMVKFCRARCDEDEAAAKACNGPFPWKAADNEHDSWIVTDAAGQALIYDEGTPSLDEAKHIARHDPARALREVAAKRAVLDSYEASVRSVGPGLSRSQLRLVAAQAAIWSDHPEYEAAWKS